MASEQHREEEQEQGEQRQQLRAPWHYTAEEAPTLPIGRRLVKLDDVRFTQRQVNDSFSHQRRPVMELIDALLEGELCPRQVPMIRVAWHEGAFWSIDNRRLFCFKHCGFKRVCLEVCEWQGNHEFEMKWRNGSISLATSDSGRKASMQQRLPDVPLPRSDVMNMAPGETKVEHWMEEEAQMAHDAKKRKFAIAHEKLMQLEEELAQSIHVAWKYSLYVEPTWRHATVMKAHADGTFDALVLLRASPPSFSLKPWCPAEDFQDASRAAARHEDAATAGPSLPPLPGDTQLTTFVVPRSTPTQLSRPWCALCQEEIQGSHSALKRHETERHRRSDFRCSSCTKSFATSSDLRKHSRSLGHEISAAFLEHVYPCDVVEPSQNDDSSSCSSQGDELALPRALEAADAPGQWNSVLPEGDVFIVAEDARSKVAGGQQVQCMVCQQDCADSRELSSHELQRHEGAMRCSQCSKVFATSSDLRKHSRKKAHAISVKFRLPSEEPADAEEEAGEPSTAPTSSQAASAEGGKAHRAKRRKATQGGGEGAGEGGSAGEGKKDKGEQSQEASCDSKCKAAAAGFVVPKEAKSKILAADGQAACCALCSRTFSKSSDLRAHEAKTHSGECRCLTCGKVFTSSADLRKHSRSLGHAIPVVFCSAADKSQQHEDAPGREQLQIVDKADRAMQSTEQTQACPKGEEGSQSPIETPGCPSGAAPCNREPEGSEATPPVQYFTEDF